MDGILVPIDFTEASLVGLKRAIEIAQKEKSQIHLVNIVSSPKKAENLQDKLDQDLNRLRENESRLSELIKKIDNKGVKINPQIRIDDFERGILKFIDNNKIDQIVVGINGAHTVGDLFCLEGQGKCIKVNCPVEVVKQAKV